MGRSRRKLALGSRSHSVFEDLEDAVCLLALITKRAPDLDGSVLPDEELPRPRKSSGLTAVTDDERGSENGDDDQEVDSDSDVDGNPSKEWEDRQIGEDRDERQKPIALQNKVLDRLAETLARFKSRPEARTSIDAKHVASTMMIVYPKDEKVKIFCSKNEGLDVDGKAFLSGWRDCMESIAKRGDVYQLLRLLVLLKHFRGCVGRK